MATTCVLPVAVEGDRGASRRRLVQPQARTGVKLEERLVALESQNQDGGDDENNANS